MFLVVVVLIILNISEMRSFYFNVPPRIFSVIRIRSHLLASTITTVAPKKKYNKRKTNQDILPFGEGPFTYHQEIIVKIVNLTNLGDGIAHTDVPNSMFKNLSTESVQSNYVVMIPGVIPGETVRARIWQNRKTYSNADLIEVLVPSPDRIKPLCPLFGECGGCQYQFLKIEDQRRWKQQHVEETLHRIGQFAEKFPCEVNPVVGTSQVFGYRTKLTPHYHRPNKDGEVNAIGFQRSKVRGQLVDVEKCPIATDEINEKLTIIRKEVKQNVKLKALVLQNENEFDKLKEAQQKKKRRNQRGLKGATLLLRHHRTGVSSDPKELVEELVESNLFKLLFRFKAGEFFQNNPYVLPLMVDHVISQASAPLKTMTTLTPNTPTNEKRSTTTISHPPKFLLDTYCGGGLFALASADHFIACAGIEVSTQNIEAATVNAQINNISNCIFIAGTAEDIFHKISSENIHEHLKKRSFSGNGQPHCYQDNSEKEQEIGESEQQPNLNGLFNARETVVVVDPPRAGCSTSFLDQLIQFGPCRIVYVSCNPATQARDARILIDAGYTPSNVTPFDLFPQTRHIENVITFDRTTTNNYLA